MCLHVIKYVIYTRNISMFVFFLWTGGFQIFQIWSSQSHLFVTISNHTTCISRTLYEQLETLDYMINKHDKRKLLMLIPFTQLTWVSQLIYLIKMYRLHLFCIAVNGCGYSVPLHFLLLSFYFFFVIDLWAITYVGYIELILYLPIF